MRLLILESYGISGPPERPPSLPQNVYSCDSMCVTRLYSKFLHSQEAKKHISY